MVDEVGAAVDRELVSIVVPVFNTEKFLDQCLASIANQTYQNIEVICINDGSTDFSPEILRSFCENDGRFFLVETANKGLSQARNEGIKRCNGYWLLFVDSDDVLVNNAVERLVCHGKTDTFDIIFFRSHPLNITGEVSVKATQFSNNPSALPAKEDFSSGLDLLASFVETNKWEPSACLQLLRLGFIRESGLGFAPGILHEDNLFTLQALMFAGRMSVVSETLYLTRPNPDSITRVAKTAHHVLGLLYSHSRGNEIFAGFETLSSRHRAGIENALEHIIHQARKTLRGIPRAHRREERRIIASFIHHLNPTTRRRYRLLTMPAIGHLVFLHSRFTRQIRKRRSRKSDT